MRGPSWARGRAAVALVLGLSLVLSGCDSGSREGGPDDAQASSPSTGSPPEKIAREDIDLEAFEDEGLVVRSTAQQGTFKDGTQRFLRVTVRGVNESGSDVVPVCYWDLGGLEFWLIEWANSYKVSAGNEFVVLGVVPLDGSPHGSGALCAPQGSPAIDHPA